MQIWGSASMLRGVNELSIAGSKPGSTPWAPALHGSLLSWSGQLIGGGISSKSGKLTSTAFYSL